MATGAFRERLFSAWTEIRENLGRSTLQALGVMLGVASVLGGFSISATGNADTWSSDIRIDGPNGLKISDTIFGG